MVDNNEDYEKNYLNNFELSIEEWNYFLELLKDLKNNYNLNQNEKDLIDILIERINQLITEDNGKGLGENKKLEKHETFDTKSNYKDSGKIKSFTNITYLKSALKNKIGYYIIINLKTGGDCCSVQGLLCNVFKDFIVLINQSETIFIKIDKIAAVIDNLNVDANHDGHHGDINYKDQYYLEEVNFTDNDSKPANDKESEQEVIRKGNDGLKVKKSQKKYLDSEDNK